ncbi:Aspartate aminotransferase, cytoplasmic isozyme 1 [Wickerhamomyces ciferrii]|uniref:Aspartate aminotransferase n=1 Tax=Wickerhamomyces ciferrii (strain ATCC 14091 / BCRC 22168 / CBS 111 / JCM 3599 / NBRC 0793 / NRRL Y-1031 F-60-10) TaxID=1206466 RepID=K0KWD7_WICCF|nr:Aspartate aminotransferase, cytoplasmic isozyme 1 [Wickerhamomyces ciferrii]CCH46272.1 Aspartate aminotransferase, cytoplasmic isozyme 1 [Wickerhamomyces ciferrii]
MLHIRQKLPLQYKTLYRSLPAINLGVTRLISTRTSSLASVSTSKGNNGAKASEHYNPIFASSAASVSSSSSKFWSHIPLAPADPILGITEDFNKDSNPRKINLSVGAYRDDLGEPFVLPSIKRASKILYEHESNKEYTGINGSKNYNTLVKNFLFGHSDIGKQFIKENRISTSQSLSGTGALKIAGEFLKNWSPYKSNIIYLSNPTWANHINIFKNCGLTPKEYTYFNPETNAINIDGLLEDLSNAAPGSSVLLHACCHNPTGLDPSRDDWNKIIEILSERQLVPIIDIAYQGFQSSSLTKDLFLIDMINEQIEAGKLPTALICQSFAKNMGLYGERIGSFSIITPDSSTTQAVDSQIKKLIRSIYSSPSIHGAKLVEIVLSDKSIYKQWEQDVVIMSDRIKEMRFVLYDLLKAKNPKSNWKHLINQNGMFCYTGLSKEQILRLKSEFSIYATLDGRFSISGINKGNVEYLAEAIDQITR